MTMPSSENSDTGISTRSKRQGWNNPFRKQKGDKPLNSTNANTNPQDNNTSEHTRNSTAKLSFSKRKVFQKVGVIPIEEYGYEEMTDYGYGPAEPNSDTIKKYGYGDSEQSHDGCGWRNGEEEPPRRRLQRRSSMPCNHQGEGVVALRRSSIKQAGAPRRESITNKGEIEITLPPSKKGEGRQVVKRRTSLTFNDETVVTPIEPAKNLARSPQDLWFQNEEMQQIRKKVSALIHKTEDGYTPHNGKRYCMRGLERMLEPEVVAVKRSQAWDTVFKEQYLQKCEGVFEEDHLANLYTFSTLRSKKDAEERASEDAREVENYLRDARRTHRRMSM